MSASLWAGDGDVEVDIADGVATLTLARPPDNGWTPLLGRIFYRTLDAVARDGSVRAIVVTGAGDNFCVGGDGDSLNNIADAGELQIAADAPTYWMPMTVGKPVVAAVNGCAFGVGLQLALFCDVRFAGTSTKLATAFVRRGLIAELGMSWLLPRIVGLGVANDLLLSGRLVRADEALRLGLVNRVVADDQLLDAARDYARGLATMSSPGAMAVIKRQVAQDLLSDLPGSVERAQQHMQDALSSADFAEGVRSWREKRPPAFADPGPDESRFALPGETQTGAP